MLSYSAKRLAVAVPTLLLLIILSFLLMHAAPGGPFTQEKALPPQVLANLNAKYGLDQPVWRQMVSYVWGIVAHFDFGPSFVYKDRTVNEIIAQGFPVTLQYGMVSFVVATLVGVALGVTAAIYHNTWLDYLAVGISIGAQVLPNFVMAPILVLVLTLVAGLAAGRRLGGRADQIHDHAGDCPVDLVHGLDRADHAVVDA
jgi:oligopeptide transport system permease protein